MCLVVVPPAARGLPLGAVCDGPRVRTPLRALCVIEWSEGWSERGGGWGLM